MNNKTRYVLLVTGIIAGVVGVIVSITGFIKENYILGIGATIILIAGLVLIAIAMGDAEDHETRY